ncbi:MAG: N-acetylneuraminate synthase family protein [Firmicutes bacterium]|nr:N-acetylneuraminate synthase family protein [Bacillota bacterium]
MIFIAEFCQNHNGDFEILKDMVWAAKESGADYAKIQNIFADMLTFRGEFEQGVTENDIVVTIKRPYQAEYERLKKLELTYKEQENFITLCKSAGIKPLTTVFTRDSVLKLKELGFDDIKIASYDCGSFPLLNEVKNNFTNIYVSTGATYDNEIIKAAEVLGGSQFSFLHCVTIYPTPTDSFNLARMEFLKKYSNNVGWSDHSLVERDNIWGTIAALYYGASIIERHFTILPKDKTKDGPVSITPEQTKEIKRVSNLSKEELLIYLKEKFPEYEKTFGNITRELTPAELLNRNYYRGRFASRNKDGNYVYNWEESEVIFK